MKINWSLVWKGFKAVFFFIVICSTLLILQGFFSNYSDIRWMEYNRASNLEQKTEDRLQVSEIFDRKLKCQDEVDKFKKRYGNTIGGSYNVLHNSCDIKFSDNQSGVYTIDMQDTQDAK